MLGFLATLLCGGIIVKEDLHRSRITQGNKAKAIKNGDAVYFDDVKSTFRATKTDEIVVHRCKNSKDEDVGVKTGRIYKSIDHNKEWEDRVIRNHEADNREMEKKNINLYWKRYRNLDYKDYKGQHHLGYYTVDKITDKPIWTTIKYNNGTVELVYASTEKRGMKTFIVNGHTKFDSRIISKDEYYEKYSPYVYKQQ